MFNLVWVGVLVLDLFGVVVRFDEVGCRLMLALCSVVALDVVVFVVL